VEQEVIDAILRQSGVDDHVIDIMVTRDNPYSYGSGERFRNIQLAYEKMRRIVLAEKYDKVWIVESDTIPPADALAKLLAIDAPVSSGLYVLRHGAPMPSVLKYETDVAVSSCMRWPEVRKHWGEVVRCSSGCTGCTLIDRKVLEGFSFITKYAGPPDGPFSDYCLANKFIWMADLSILCGHKTPDGRILWPQDFKGCN
jgi:hypothetical protein